MKIQIKSYIFDALAKQITFSDYDSIDLDSILLITNVTSNVIIYNFAKTGGSVLGNVLTLDFDTSEMNDSDDLQIFYEDSNMMPITEETGQEILSAIGGGNYKKRVAESGGYVYVGYASLSSDTSSAAWRIKRISATGSEDWADGDDQFNNIWDNYATLTYL